MASLSEEELDSMPEPYCVNITEETSREVSIRISQPIESSLHHDSVCHLLESLNPGDTVRMYINSPGGEINAGLALISAMARSPAHITTILNPEACSMGALLFLAGDAFEVPPFSRLMFHNYSSGGGGRSKGNEQIAEVQSSQKWFEQLMTDICYPFLSKAELRSILEGKDLWLLADDIIPRLEAVTKKGAGAKKS